MFYLGSIAGVLPYILAFTLTILLGGHAGFSFFASETTSESKNKTVEENNLPSENLKNFEFDKKIVIEKFASYIFQTCTPIKVFNFYFSPLFSFTEFGISLLRAPPVFFL